MNSMHILGRNHLPGLGKNHKSKEVVEPRLMVYVIEGDKVLVSKAVLKLLG